MKFVGCSSSFFLSFLFSSFFSFFLFFSLIFLVSPRDVTTCFVSLGDYYVFLIGRQSYCVFIFRRQDYALAEGYMAYWWWSVTRARTIKALIPVVVKIIRKLRGLTYFVLAETERYEVHVFYFFQFKELFCCIPNKRLLSLSFPCGIDFYE